VGELVFLAKSLSAVLESFDSLPQYFFASCSRITKSEK
jgi:hypothetical protein